jgi:predicted AlkP superfamily phosphohydrolase/phosphomutase
MVDDGVLPNIAEFYTDGAVAPLESQLPPWTPSAWPSLYTGFNPAKHGVYDFLRFKGYDWDVVNRSHVKAHAVWELLSMEGYSSVVVNVPVTHPPREFDGILVPGYTAPEAPECYPTGVWDELNSELGEYTLYTDPLGSGSSEAERKRGYRRLSQMRGSAFRYLIQKHDPDFGFVQFQQCDTVFHEFPDEPETVRRVYKDIDAEIDEILNTCEPDVTLLVSDHGIGPMNGHEFRVNDYLRDKGLVTATGEGGGMPSWKSVSRKRLQDGKENGPVAQSPAERALELAARVGVTSQRLGAVVQRLGLEDVVLKIVPDDIIRAGAEQVDFPASTAYMRSRTEMGVRLNVDGREPAGIVPASEYEQVRDDVIDTLTKATTPEGVPVFERVAPREAVFEGPYLDDAPDIVTVPNRFDHFLVANLKGAQFGEPTEPWEHKREGIVMISGGESTSDVALQNSHLFDIAPTILSTFGLPVDTRMDGSPLPVIGSTGEKEYPQLTDEKITTTEDATIEERLSNLGYLD